MRTIDDYYWIPEHSDHISGTSVLTRMLDGRGFRFYWATEGLRPEDYAFRPADDKMSIGERVLHVWKLVNWVSTSALKKPYEKLKDYPAARTEVLGIIHNLRETIFAMSDDDLGSLRIRDKSFWNMVNGPFSDA